jgi:branched-chain amino acid transport system substrate-binding protein
VTKPILIGGINSYSAPVLLSFTVPYRKGIELSLEQINGAGGVLSRPLEVVFRDDELRPEHGAKQAERLIAEDNVDLLAGAFTSDIVVAIAEVADRHRKIYFASEPRTDALIWERGSRYVFRLRTCQSSMLSMLVELAVSRPERKWAVVVAMRGRGRHRPPRGEGSPAPRGPRGTSGSAQRRFSGGEDRGYADAGAQRARTLPRARGGVP